MCTRTCLLNKTPVCICSCSKFACIVNIMLCSLLLLFIIVVMVVVDNVFVGVFA